jgi:hypothetical protein
MDNEPILEIDEYGTKEWWLNGGYHREDGPAVEFSNGEKQWCLNDKLHRVDGPALESADGSNHWFLDDEYYTFDKWLEANTYISEEEKVMIKLTYG